MTSKPAPPAANSPALIQASELAQYGFCHRAWWLGTVKGVRSANRTALARGTRQVARHRRAAAAAEVRVDPHPHGATFGVRVSPGSAREAVRGVHGDLLKISVREAPERGRANRGVVELLARVLDRPKGDLEILRGQTSRTKTVLVRGVTPDRLERSLARILGE